MDAMHVLAHQTVMGLDDGLRSALPDAPRCAGQRREVGEVRVRVARVLRHTADRLDPARPRTATG